MADGLPEGFPSGYALDLAERAKMTPVIKKEALGASSSFSTADSRRSQETKKFELGKVVHFAGKETTERKWQSWWDWHCVRPLPCGLCPMKFLNRRLLAAHHTRHHKLGSK
ncbi:hypothetical protein MRX96_029730 [Rhipicephalus microplus]